MFKDAQFLTAKEKEKLVKNMKSFLKNDFSITTFTDALYKHFSLHCGFIAHYDRNGFWNTYFTSPEGKVRWAKAFCGYSEMGDYTDVNKVLKEMIHEHMLLKMGSLRHAAKERDIAQAKDLLKKHGISLTDYYLEKMGE